MRSSLFHFTFLVLTILLGTACGAGGQSAAAIPENGNTSSSQSGENSTIVDREDDEDSGSACTEEPGDCTLRGAINKANSDYEATTITFAEDYRIRLTRLLPKLTDEKTTIEAAPGQEVHVDGANQPGPVFDIGADGSRIIGLRIYGSGNDMPNIRITDSAKNVIIARNVIGDGDRPSGPCESSPFSGHGIQIESKGPLEKDKRAWIYGNIIECIDGQPGNGITITTDGVMTGQNENKESNLFHRNKIRKNMGFGIDLDDYSDNDISHNTIYENQGGIKATNFNNTFADNDVK